MLDDIFSEDDLDVQEAIEVALGLHLGAGVNDE